jgi:hypothetical protein
VSRTIMTFHIQIIFQWTVLLDLFELFDLEVKGQGPTKVITVRDTSSYGHAPTTMIRRTTTFFFFFTLFIAILPQIKLIYVERRETYCFSLIFSSATRKYYLKNNYLTLRSTVKVPWRSLWYATHRLKVMYPHTKYDWPISKDKKVMVFCRYVPPIFPIVVFILVFFCFQFSSKFWLVNILIDPLHIYKITFQWLWDFPNSFVRGTWLWKLKTMIRRTTTFFFFFTLFIAILPQIKLIYVERRETFFLLLLRLVEHICKRCISF